MPKRKKSDLHLKKIHVFHNTYQFLKHYRDATYSLKVVVHQLENQFQQEYGTSIDTFLDSLYTAGAEFKRAVRLKNVPKVLNEAIKC